MLIFTPYESLLPPACNLKSLLPPACNLKSLLPPACNLKSLLPPACNLLTVMPYNFKPLPLQAPPSSSPSLSFPLRKGGGI